MYLYMYVYISMYTFIYMYTFILGGSYVDLKRKTLGTSDTGKSYHI
jgi:hypothetical protein